MPKPLKFPTKVLIGFDDRQLALIDDWRRKQAALPSRSEAIRRLVEKALTISAVSTAPPAATTARPAKAPQAAAKPARVDSDDGLPKSKADQIAALRRGESGRGKKR